MERSNTLGFDDEYIPSGSWYPQGFDETQIQSFFPENHPPPPYLHKTTHQKTYHNLDSVNLDSSISKNNMVNSQNYYSNRSLNDELFSNSHSSSNFDEGPSHNSYKNNNLENVIFSNCYSCSNFEDDSFSNAHSNTNFEDETLAYSHSHSTSSKSSSDMNLKDVLFSKSHSNSNLMDIPLSNFHSNSNFEDEPFLKSLSGSKLKDVPFSNSNSNSKLKDVPFSNSNSNSNLKDDPFSVRCRIPVPDSMSGYHMWLETSFMCRRNERERQRVRSVNDGFSKLRNHLPRGVQMRRRQSKVDTLRNAITYIKQLQKLVDEKAEERK
ncbi:hypothetical protein JTE90_022331 [Oedothorax gibbosus]|uniref:BHLH domain-containing protein n=1 Tax=Oedothorax gibbosus TaxID=931172 RepID=A0AAV6VXA1_9ARAC|nr:hypothetical protein JTE90_022331 [Oedothorax gibbosus]